MTFWIATINPYKYAKSAKSRFGLLCPLGVNIVDSYESKLDAVLKAIEALIVRTRALENLASRVGTNPRTKIPQSTQHVVVEGPTTFPSQRKNCSNQNLDGGAAKYREPRISLLEKFDGTRSKFQQFINLV
jgi:phage tail sheath protein FI